MLFIMFGIYLLYICMDFLHQNEPEENHVRLFVLSFEDAFQMCVCVCVGWPACSALLRCVCVFQGSLGVTPACPSSDLLSPQLCSLWEKHNRSAHRLHAPAL